MSKRTRSKQPKSEEASPPKAARAPRGKKGKAAAAGEAKNGDAEVEGDRNGVLLKGWFSEVNTQWPGTALSVKVEETLWDQKSQYQHVQVFKTPAFGNMLVLDGVIQITEKDECAYQEMITQLPMFSHPNPERVLIVGGGDGGVLREVLRHDTVKEVVMCEIDDMVIECGKKFFPTVATGFSDPRLTLHSGDAAVFMKQPENKNSFDVIVSDSSDPIGPAASLFERPFYQNMHDALRPGGIVCTQAEGLWMHLDLIGALLRDTKNIFAHVEYATTQIPTYPCGQIGFLIGVKAGGNKKALSCRVPERTPSEAVQAALRYYSAELHSAAFCLPAFVKRAISA